MHERLTSSLQHQAIVACGLYIAGSVTVGLFVNFKAAALRQAQGPRERSFILQTAINIYFTSLHLHCWVLYLLHIHASYLAVKPH